MRRILPVLCAAGAWAQSGIEVPSIGAIVDPAGALRPVQGVAGNFLLGPAAASEALSVACSERRCLAKTDSEIISTTGRTDAPAGPAIFGVNGDDAIVFFPDSRTFARWHDDILESLDWKVDGYVVSVRANEIAVRRQGSVWIVRPDGALVDWIAETDGPVLLLPAGVIFATKDEIVLRRGNSEARFALADAESITAMGPHYSAIRAGGVTYALRTEPGRESLFLLPGTAP